MRMRMRMRMCACAVARAGLARLAHRWPARHTNIHYCTTRTEGQREGVDEEDPEGEVGLGSSCHRALLYQLAVQCGVPTAAISTARAPKVSARETQKGTQRERLGSVLVATALSYTSWQCMWCTGSRYLYSSRTEGLREGTNEEDPEGEVERHRRERRRDQRRLRARR